MRSVKPIGPTNSPPLALVGEAPGREEDLRGIPFVGKSGFLLDQMLSKIGVGRNGCYITNVANVRPPNNDFNFFLKEGNERMLADFRLRLWKEIEEVKPKVIVALGEQAMVSLIQKKGITKYRGMMYERDHRQDYKLRVIPTFHPAYVQRIYSTRPIVEMDLAKAYRQALSPSTPRVDFFTFPSLDGILCWLAERHSPVSVDLETLGSKLHTRCIGLAWSETEAISIPLIRGGNHCWTEEEEFEILSALREYLEDPSVEKYFQNAPFDTTVLAREFGVNVSNVKLDTMFGHHLLYSELPKSLDFLTSIHTDFPMYWEETGSDQNNATYNCYDCCVTWMVAQRVEAELKERDMWDFYQEVIHPAVFALTRMQNRGVLIDIEARERVRRETEEKMLGHREWLSEAVGKDFNPGSPKQVKELVYGKLNLPPQKAPGTRSITTRDDALQALSRKFPQHKGLIQHILEHRSLRVLLSTYINAELTDDHRSKTSYNLAGTVTGRISSSKTIDGYGGNLQNIPRGDFRRIFRADPGKVIIKADLEQAEFRCFCWFAPVPSLIETYTLDSRYDIHRLNASMIYNIPEDKITKTQRSTAKNGVYAGNYGAGPLKMSRLYDMDFKQAKMILERWKRVRPELLRWQERIRDELRATRKLRNPFGRERIFFGRMDDATFRAAYSHTCQSTVADIILEAIVTLDQQGVEILLQVHDELVCQCPEEEVEETVEKMRNAMEIPIQVPGVEQPLVIPVEISVGPNWYDVKPWGQDAS